ncbi:MAG: hypothetical protein WD651_10930 [Acidimicrobiia bacterium]
MDAELVGTIKMAGEGEPGVRVEVHLDQEELLLVSPNGTLGQWPLSQIGVSARVDGFHLRIEGEELVLSTSDDARFAMALGIRSTSSPRLIRQLAAANDIGPDGGVIALDFMPEVAVEPQPVEMPRDSSPVAMGIIAAGALVLIGAVFAVASGSTMELFGWVPMWPWSVAAALGLATGGFAMLAEYRGARALVTTGTAIGMVALIGSLISSGLTGFSWISDGVLLAGVGTVLAALLLSVDRLNRTS